MNGIRRTHGTRTFGRRLAVIGTAVAAASALTGTVATAEPATGAVDYVNLGDSFSAAAGVAPTVPGSDTMCSRSELNFAHDLAADRGYRLTDVSCAGAKTENFYTSQFPGVAPQLDALSESTDLVTMTIGGNNNDTFATAIAECVAAAVLHPTTWDPCREQYGTALSDPVTTHTYPALVQALRDVHTRAPHARVAIIGYPWLLPAEGSCAPQMPIAAGDVPYLRDLQSTLNDTIARAATETGTRYVDMAAASTGHDACGTPQQRWIEPIIGALQPVPVHPNAAGEQGVRHRPLTPAGRPPSRARRHGLPSPR